MRSKQLLLASACAFGVLASAAPAMAATIQVDDNGLQCPNAAYQTIQAAVAGASAGDTIVVCPGTYTGPITVDKAVKITNKPAHSAYVNAPATQNSSDANYTAVFTVTAGPANISGFRVNAQTATAEGGCNGDIYGIRVIDGAKATINNNFIANATPSDPTLIGCQYGLAVAVGGYNGNLPRTTGIATINQNVITGYAKEGVYVDGVGSKGTISHNTITGIGCVDTIAQNGIQISRGAKATITTNTVSDNCYTKNDGYLADGILLYQPGYSVVVGSKTKPALGNTLNNNDVGLDVEGTFKSAFGFNQITGSGTTGGIGIANYAHYGSIPDSSSNTYMNNTVSNNQQDDCYDETTGTKTAGTANTWTGNTGATSQPTGLCTA